MFQEDYEEVTQEDFTRKKMPENILTRIVRADKETIHKAQKLLAENKISKAEDRLDLLKKLQVLYKNKGESLIPSIIDIHPDKIFFEQFYDKINKDSLDKLKDEYEKQIDKLNLEVRFAGVKKYGDDGSVETSKIPQVIKQADSKFEHLALIGLVGIFGISMLYMAKQSK